jgi:hypothetical protein
MEKRNRKYCICVNSIITELKDELTQAHSELFLTPHEELKPLRLAEAKFTPLGVK